MRDHFRAMALVLILPLGVWGAMQIQGPVLPGAPKPENPPGPTEVAPTATPTGSTTAVEPKPIGASVKKGLDWLVEHQLKDGGWGQGDESQQMGGGAALRDKANVADTCVAALALIRSGSTPSTGPYKDAVVKAVRFVRKEVAGSDSKSLAVSNIQGTRVQAKLGPNIDTFLASLLLAEVKDRMAEPDENKTVEVALNKILGKIKAHQKADGSWDNQAGWAPILAQSMAGKGINRAFQNGANVDAALLARTESFAKDQFATSAPAAAGEVISADSYSYTVGRPIAVAAASPSATVPGGATRTPTVVGTSAPGTPAAPVGGPVSVAILTDGSSTTGRTTFAAPSRMSGMMSGRGGAGSAGVELYDRASSLAVLQDSVNTNKTKEAELLKVVETSKDQPAVADAKKELTRFKAAQFACDNAQEQVIARLDDKGFLAGFGSNGGEEFLSYMNIGESLVLKGGPAWKKWDEAMTANLNRIQNDDGSWTGHHCITGRTFCTSTALLVLLSDRTPVPNQAREKPLVQ
jgi:hypothetical protein